MAKCLVGVSLLAAVGILSLVWWTTPTCHVARATFEQIEEGMSRAEVATIIGFPPGIYCTGRTAIEIDTGTTGPCWCICDDLRMFDSWTEGERNEDGSPLIPSHTWVTNTGAIKIYYDANNKVLQKNYYEVRVSGFLERLRYRVGI